MLSDMERFYFKHGIEDQSKLVFLGKSHFTRFHLHVHGLKQREIKVLSYIVNTLTTQDSDHKTVLFSMNVELSLYL